MSVLTKMWRENRKKGRRGGSRRKGRRTGHFYTFKGRVKGVEVQYEKDIKAALLCSGQRSPRVSAARHGHCCLYLQSPKASWRIRMWRFHHLNKEIVLHKWTVITSVLTVHMEDLFCFHDWRHRLYSRGLSLEKHLDNHGPTWKK